MKILVGILVVVVILILMTWSGRGTLITNQEEVNNAWGDVQNVYQRRFDLIPNVLTTVDNFMSRQERTIKGATEARQRVINIKTEAVNALSSGDAALLDSLSAQLSTQMNSLINMVKEAYPDIKGDQLYSDALVQLEGTENRVAQERRNYNKKIRKYNTYRKKGISGLMAGAIFGFPYELTYFKASAEAQSAPDAGDHLN